MLSGEDTADLSGLVDRDPVAHIFVRAQLDVHGSAAPEGGPLVLGYFDDGQLTSACWVGANIVPLNCTALQAKRFGEAVLRLGRSFSSLFGPASAVRGMWEVLRFGPQTAFDIRASQPLLATGCPPAVPPAATVRPSVPEEYDAVLPACAAMFQEELGYSPLGGGGGAYRQRVRSLIDQGHSFVDIAPDGAVIFKSELGTVTRHVTQIQGVWMSPEFRGRGLAAGYMAAVVRHALMIAPVTSLYVNDFNAPALAAYQRVGFEKVGDFATVLF
ncbi:N-acetyltransferase GCN5 [Zhihengliuella salsuginis]|uniref:N-acetyltransferase GCN5 n=1 Tax=Zhihengliuella salsuginis TaxID=578222 RepID=A0ABQ3GHS2_9MICC|nr:N-acetyltransferase GCN5 [Zhihengliuella salsuginis]